MIFKNRKISDRSKILFVMNALLVLLLLWVRVTDETKDDLSIQLYISACDGIENYYHMWASAFRMFVTYGLQKLCPVFAWNYLLQVILIFISINIICNKIMKKFPNIYGGLFAVFTGIALFFQTISTLNFTRTAALIMCAGICPLFEEGWKRKTAGGVWFIIGTLMRFNAVYISIGFLAVLCFAKLLNEEDQAGKRVGKILKLYIAPIVFVFLGVYGMRYAGMRLIGGEPQWRQLFEKNILSENLLDYDLMPYEDATEEYQEWGITENDCDMIRYRMSNSDNEYFTPELYEVFITHFSQKWEADLSGDELQIWMGQLKKYLTGSMFGWFILSSFLVGFLTANSKNRWIIGINFACLCSYLILFCVMGRVVDRVSFGVYLWAGIALLNGCEFHRVKAEKRFALNAAFHHAAVALSCLFIIGFTVFMGIKYQRHVNPEIAELYDYMEENRQYFYVYSGFSEYRSIPNLLYMSDYWNTNNSFYSSNYDISLNEISKMSEYGIKNIYRDAVDSDAIRFINNESMDVIETYIREHYCSTAKAVLQETAAGYSVYRIIDVS